MYSENQNIPDDVEWDIVLGDQGGNHSLLLARWKNIDPGMDPRQIQDMYQHILKDLCCKDGFEDRRPGGSSGLAEPSGVFFKYLQEHPGCFPRKPLGVKFFRNTTKWWCFYRNAKNQAQAVWYSQPVMGGKFHVSPTMMQEHPFLYRFAESKMHAALILQKLNEIGYRIQPEAVAYELETFQKCSLLATDEPLPTFPLPYSERTNRTNNKHSERRQAAAGVSKVPSRKKRKASRKPVDHDTGRSNKEKSALAQFASHNMFTAVAHSVGFHRDVFDGKGYCLENKVCFVVPGRHPSMYGRGGAGGGNGKFVVALLDWKYGARNRLRQHIVAVGAADGNFRLTPQFIYDYFRANPQVSQMDDEFRAMAEENCRDVERDNRKKRAKARANNN